MSRTTHPKKLKRETSAAALRSGMVRLVQRRIVGKGEVDFPCIPTMLEVFMGQLVMLWDALGKPFSPEELAGLRKLVESGLNNGYRSSPFARLVVEYRTQALPKAGITYAVGVKKTTLEEQYAQWIAQRTPPLFGKFPDAKVLALAEELGDPASAPVLDVGAGTGRNALPLARRGHPVDAMEVVPALADELQKARQSEDVPIELIVADILSDEEALKPGHYKLIILAEVIASHFREVEDIRRVFAKFADALAPGGIVLINAFLAAEDYQPDLTARQISHTAWSCIFTRADLKFITEELPFDRISDESVHDYEMEHLPSGGWPPTDWFIGWSQGTNVFAAAAGGKPPLIELRWLVYRRR